MDIKDKIAIVTGASEGIGRATARALSRERATVVLAARSKDLLQELVKELPDSLAVPTDMRVPEDIEKLIDITQKKFGRIDILINNAGQGMYGPLESIDIEKYQSIIDLNIHGPLRAMQAAIPVMRIQGGGAIINVSSMVSKNYFPNLSAYASTKYALNALSLTARAELKNDNIIIGVMYPRLTATEFGKNAVGGHPDFSARAARGDVKIDTPEDVAEKIIELIRSGEAESEMK